jgi:LPPG:FO 2-phospho-L-lactate transferase
VNVTVLAGGVGGARFLAGLAASVPEATLTAICNVGDDFEWHGLHVSPDIDTVIYTLAGIEGELGWGIRGDSRTVLEALAPLGGETWFAIGDLDLATHLHRTRMLREGHTLSEATAALVTARAVRARVLPVTDDPHPTVVLTEGGTLAFQEYFVKRGAQDRVLGFHFPGAEAAHPGPGVLEAVGETDLVFLAPSNPFVSIDPILAVPGVRNALREARGLRTAVSPIVGGRAVKGPAAAMLSALGHEVSALGVARLYAGIVDCFVLDQVDASLAASVERLGMRAVVADTMMTDAEARGRVAASIVEAVLAG